MDKNFSTGLYNKPPVLELNNINILTDKFNNPQKSLKFIHVAGTNGKGSVCTFLQSILMSAGFKVGKYTSPDIKNNFDSISINNKNITHKKISSLYNKILATKTNITPSDFEVLTTAAFLYFKEEACDYVILETGLGGIGDATNIIDTPLYSVITKISYDHMNFLGNTLEKIAEKKVGIIKEKGKTITLKQEPEVLKIISDRCLKKDNGLILTASPQILLPENTHEHFRYKGLDIISGLSGYYQIENACLAIEVALNLGVDKKFITEGIMNAHNPARFEKISETPPIIFDGAHNPDGFEALLFSLSRYFPNTPKNLIIGVMKDKDIHQMAMLLKKYNEDKLAKIYTVEVQNNPRSENPNVLKDILASNGFFAECAYTLENALSMVNSNLTVICGSLYMYREIPCI